MIWKNSTENCQICIFGPQILQNGLLAGWIIQKTGFSSQCCQSTDIAKVINNQEKGQTLILWDCVGKGVATLWLDLGARFGEGHSSLKIALFNVSPQIDIQIEKQALKRGISGLFLNSCSRSVLLKGIKAMLNGEVWFSRRVMTEALLDRQGNEPVSPALEKPLTPREKEILLCILSGASNKQISFDLYISPHTVKTHIYNIYKKINVPNRLQATLWSAKNL